jgi:hypothetical protein
MVLVAFGLFGLIAGITLPAAESYFEHDWPRKTWYKGLSLITLGLLCLCYVM